MPCPYSFEDTTATERCVHPARAIAPSLSSDIEWKAPRPRRGEGGDFCFYLLLVLADRIKPPSR